MSKKNDPDVNDRLAALERDIGALKDSLSLLTQTLGKSGAGGFAGNVPAETFANPPLFQGNALAFPFFFYCCRKLPFSFPPQRIAGQCAGAKATIVVPGPGNYILTINVPRESDCSVLVTDPAGITAFGPVGPGDSLARSFTFYTPRLIASCQGRGERCLAEITLTQLS